MHCSGTRFKPYVLEDFQYNAQVDCFYNHFKVLLFSQVSDRTFQMSNRRLEDVSLTCILNHYMLKTSSKRLFDI